MKKLIFLFLIVLPFVGCSDDEKKEEAPSNLIDVTSRMRISSNNSPFSGYLEITPCVSNSYVYYGNYINEKQSPFYAAYLINNGNILSSIRPLILPIGAYDLIYWGFVIPEDTLHLQASVSSPSYSIGSDMANESWALRPYKTGDTLYRPVYDLAHCAKEVEIGTENIAVPLERAVAAIQVILNAPSGGTLHTDIDTIFAYIGDIANEINFITAEPTDFTKTICFSLSMAADRQSASSFIMKTFPSAPNPLFTLRVYLKNGEVKEYSQRLSNQLLANNKISLTLEGNVIFSETTSSSGFEINNWQEENEQIDLPPLE